MSSQVGNLQIKAESIA